MFLVKNLRKESNNGWTALKCDFVVSDFESPFSEKTMWVAVEDKYADMLSDELYDPFVLVPTILGMYYKQDVYFDGNVSPRLYHNLTHYLLDIFDNFSDLTKKVSVTVKSTKVMSGEKGTLIGTGISCGVDSLLTIFDNYVNTSDPEFKINSLFFVNCGTHGDFENEDSRNLWKDRAALNAKAAKDLGLPMYLIDSNFHAFTHKIGEQKIGYLAIYSCVLSLQKCIRRYLTSSNLSYDEIADSRKLSRDFDIAEYCESYMPHLISTERFELVIDGCQYTRAQKTERISEWDIAKSHLNVCVSPNKGDHGKNCSRCNKCMWTLIPLEAMGKLDDFNSVFDIDVYRQNAKYFKEKFVLDYGEDAMESSIVDYCNEKELPMPTKERILSERKAVKRKRAVLQRYWSFREKLGKMRRKLIK